MKNQNFKHYRPIYIVALIIISMAAAVLLRRQAVKYRELEKSNKETLTIKNF